MPCTRLRLYRLAKADWSANADGDTLKIYTGNLLVKNKGLFMTGSNLGTLLKERLCRVVGCWESNGHGRHYLRKIGSALRT